MAGRRNDVIGAEDSDVYSDATSRSERFFRTLVESRTGIMLLFGRDGTISYASPSTSEILGVSPERVVGNSIWSILHPESCDDVDGIGLEGGTYDGVFRLRRNGGWVAVRGSVQNLLGEPNVNGIILAGRQVGQSDSGSQSLTFEDDAYHTVFDSAPVGLARVSPDGRWLRVNRSLCEMLGYEREELLGRTFREITHSDDLAAEMQTMQEFLSGERTSVTTEKRYIKKDYSVAWVNLSASLVRDENGEPLYFDCVIQSIAKEVEARRISSTLTSRERSVLGLLAHGKTNKQIAFSLRLSLSSAKVYVRRIVEKLDATDRTHAAVRAAHLGLLPDSEN